MNVNENLVLDTNLELLSNLLVNIKEKHKAENEATREEIQKEIARIIEQCNADSLNKGVHDIIPLHLAVSLNDFDTIGLLGQKGVNMSVFNQEGYAPIYYPLKDANNEMLKFLLENGADPNILSEEVSSAPISMAAYELNLEAVECIIEHKADLSTSGTDALYASYVYNNNRYPELTELLLNNQANPTMPDSLTDNILGFAVRTRKPKDVKLFLEHNADPNIADGFARYPLHYVCLNGYYNIAQQLLDSGADINKLTQDIDQVLMDDEAFATPVHWAYHGVPNGKKVVRQFIKAGLDSNTKDSLGYTIFHEACKKEDFETVQIILEQGWDYNIQDNQGRSPLYYAYFSRNNKIIELILNSGNSDPNFEDVSEDPLYKACLEVDKDTTESILGRHGANKDLVMAMATSMFYKGCFDIKPSRGEYIDYTKMKLLLANGVDPNITKHGDLPRGKTIYNDANLEMKHVIFNDKIIKGKEGGNKLFKFLLENGLNPNCENVDGQSLLVMLIKNNNFEAVTELQKYISSPEEDYKGGVEVESKDQLSDDPVELVFNELLESKLHVDTSDLNKQEVKEDVIENLDPFEVKLDGENYNGNDIE